jgi:hypothetical protein
MASVLVGLLSADGHEKWPAPDGNGIRQKFPWANGGFHDFSIT